MQLYSIRPNFASEYMKLICATKKEVETITSSVWGKSVSIKFQNSLSCARFTIIIFPNYLLIGGE